MGEMRSITRWAAVGLVAGMLLGRGGDDAGAIDLINTIATIKANQQIYTLWQAHGKDMAEDALTSALEGMVGASASFGPVSLQVTDLLSTQYWLDLPPGFQKLMWEEIRLRVPVLGFWAAMAKFKVHATISWWFINWNFDFKVTMVAFNVWAKATVFVNSSDPEAPVIASVPPPQVNANVVFWTNQWWLNLVVPFLLPMANEAIEDAIAAAIAQMTPVLDGLAGLPGEPFGTGGPPLVDSGEPTDFEGAALYISQKIQQYHMPTGCVVEAGFSTPYYGTWEESLANPNFSPGTPLWYGGFGDSAIWSGHYLAAEAFRYAETGDPQAAANALVVLGAFDIMTMLKGVPRWLARSVRPWDQFPPGPNSDYVPIEYGGVVYAADNFISRDQYMGVFMGCAAAEDFIDDPNVKAKAKEIIERMLDYLLINDWAAYRLDGEISTVWHMNYAQMCAWVRVGFRVNPSKYWDDLLEHIWLEDLVWISPWLETMDPVVNSYYKFNLQHGAFMTLLRLETIPIFWQRVYKGFRVLRKALAHHQNPHFNMCEISAVPALGQGPMGGETREALRQWLKRKRRNIAFDTMNDPEIQKVWYEPLSLGDVFGADAETPWDNPNGQWVAAQPVPIVKRNPTDFLWQRSPFGLSSGGGTPNGESPGVDYILPYWMGRYYGVFPDP